MKDFSFQSTSARIDKMMTDDMKNHDRTDKSDIETRTEILQN